MQQRNTCLLIRRRVGADLNTIVKRFMTKGSRFVRLSYWVGDGTGLDGMAAMGGVSSCERGWCCGDVV